MPGKAKEKNKAIEKRVVVHKRPQVQPSYSGRTFFMENGRIVLHGKKAPDTSNIEYFYDDNGRPSGMRRTERDSMLDYFLSLTIVSLAVFLAALLSILFFDIDEQGRIRLRNGKASQPVATEQMIEQKNSAEKSVGSTYSITEDKFRKNLALLAAINGSISQPVSTKQEAEQKTEQETPADTNVQNASFQPEEDIKERITTYFATLALMSETRNMPQIADAAGKILESPELAGIFLELAERSRVQGKKFPEIISGAISGTIQAVLNAQKKVSEKDSGQTGGDNSPESPVASEAQLPSVTAGTAVFGDDVAPGSGSMYRE